MLKIKPKSRSHSRPQSLADSGFFCVSLTIALSPADPQPLLAGLSLCCGCPSLSTPAKFHSFMKMPQLAVALTQPLLLLSPKIFLMPSYAVDMASRKEVPQGQALASLAFLANRGCSSHS